MPSIGISAVVVLYNPSSAEIKNIISYKNILDELILVDNSSSDNSNLCKDILSDNIKYFPLLKNTGIAYALNFGIKKATSSNKFIITLDQDSTLTKSILDEYKDQINKLNDLENIVLAPNFRTDRKNEVKGNGLTEISFSMQSAMLFSRDIFEKFGLFQEDLFIDVVDFEYCLRLKRAGIKIFRCNDAILEHKPANTKTLNLFFIKFKYGEASPVRYYYQIRNLLFVSRKYRSLKMLKLFFVKLLKIILLFDNKKAYLALAFKGIKDFWNNRLGEYNE